MRFLCLEEVTELSHTVCLNTGVHFFLAWQGCHWYQIDRQELSFQNMQKFKSESYVQELFWHFFGSQPKIDF